jgi:hypothetical protein
LVDGFIIWPLVLGANECLAVRSMLMTARPSGRRALRLRREITDADVAVLMSLHKLRLLTTEQLRRLHGADGDIRITLRRTQARLKRLHDLKLVVRLSRVVGGVRAGSSGFVYGLSGWGQAVLEVGGTFGGRRRRLWETRPYFQDHMLAVSELYVRLVEAERRHDFELLDFQGEPQCWRYMSGPSGEVVPIKPDAFVRVGVGDFEHQGFAEVDMGTESLPTIMRKSQRYIDYWRSGEEQRRHGVFPRVVWLVPDDRRQVGIQKALGRLALEAQDLFAVGLLADGPHMLVPAASARGRGPP